jgi:hypothetical protein
MAVISEIIDKDTIKVSVNSTNIKEMFYNTTTKDLDIIFTNDNTYRYQEISWELFTKLRLAESQGKFFSQFIRNKFKFQKI